MGLNSLVVTLSMLICYRGLARVFLEDKSISKFPQWFATLGQKNLVGPFPMALLLFLGLFALAIVILQYSGFGRTVYVIGNSKDVARYAGVRVPRVKFLLYIASGLMCGPGRPAAGSPPGRCARRPGLRALSWTSSPWSCWAV